MSRPSLISLVQNTCQLYDLINKVILILVIFGCLFPYLYLDVYVLRREQSFWLALKLTQLQILQLWASETALTKQHWFARPKLSVTQSVFLEYLTYSFYRLQIIFSRAICNSLCNYCTFLHCQAKSDF